jgi:nucleotide-binding universal stress UspA family protein
VRGEYVMPYKAILVHVESTAEARTKLAFDLARRHNAILLGLAAAVWTVPVVYAEPAVIPITSDTIEREHERVQEELKAASALFRRLSEEVAVRTEWRSLEGFPYGALCSAANAADLIVAGSLGMEAGQGVIGLSPGELLIGSGRPVLVVPDKIEKLEARNIVVAWKNTREARRAVADALPLLSGAESVTLLQVREPGSETDSINDLHQLLACHGIRATIRIVEPELETEVDLVRLAREAKSDLIVAGAYGQSRLREWAFGGVTRGLLKQNAVVCQLSH